MIGWDRSDALEVEHCSVDWTLSTVSLTRAEIFTSLLRPLDGNCTPRVYRPGLGQRAETYAGRVGNCQSVEVELALEKKNKETDRHRAVCVTLCTVYAAVV